MTVPAHLSLVTLGVVNVPRASGFYQSLGWPKLPSSGDQISFLQVGAVVLSLYERAALADDAGVDVSGQGFRATSLGINLPSPAHVDAAVSTWAAAGGSIVKQPCSVFWGGYSGYVADLDGHLWEIAFNPHSPEWAAVVPAESAEVQR